MVFTLEFFIKPTNVAIIFKRRDYVFSCNSGLIANRQVVKE